MRGAIRSKFALPGGTSKAVFIPSAFSSSASIQWDAADVHYTAAHYYDPAKAQFTDFDPFWEFVSGPLNAGTFGPNKLDNTFGPRAAYQKGCSKEQGENLAPCFGLQFFGHVAIDGATEVLTVTLKDIDDHSLWSIKLEPRRA